jgi:decaprenyl-phosphate phosphoribosyltransferase
MASEQATGDHGLRAEAAAPAVVRPSRAPALLLRAARPRQWSKNVLLLAAPVAAGAITQGSTLSRSALAVLAFCLISSAAYLLNDAHDAPADRIHPRKRRRPVASGAQSVATAVSAGLTLALSGLALSLALGAGFAACGVAYVALSLTYTLGLRDVAVLDLASVTGLFVIRAVAGGVAVDIPLSRWFLLVTSFSALFVVAGKRSSELARGEDLGSRPALAEYSLDYLRHVWTLASAAAIGAYCIWAFSRPHGHFVAPWAELSIIPFVLGVLRYSLLIDQARAEAPEETLAEDRTLQLIGLAWIALFVCSAYPA